MKPIHAGSIRNLLILLIFIPAITQANETSSGKLTAEQISQQANQSYVAQQWADAADKYQQVVEHQPGNEQAWFRLAQSYINLQQGDKAQLANNQLKDARQIPAPFVLYQQAQILALLNDTDSMWTTLTAAAKAGYSNLNELTSREIWSAYRDDARFEQLTKLVDKNLRPCMHNDSYREFDFWLGEWAVYTDLQQSAPPVGHNSITLTEQGCLIRESWKSASGGTGFSMNYFNPILNQWVQRWVSNGAVIDYTGGLVSVDGKEVMHLVGKIHYAAPQQQPAIRDFKGTWTPLENGVVQQYFEESIDGGKTWYPWFNGYYFKLEGKNETP